MRRSVKIILGVLGFFVVVFIGAIIVLANYDWNKHKPWLTQTLSKALDRKVVIAGDLEVHWERDPTLRGFKSWFPGPRVTADKVSIGNPSWSKSPTFATVSRVEMDVSVLPLLAHTVSIPAMKFDDPDVHIERVSEKRNNWTFGNDADTGAGSAWKFDFGRVQFAKGKIEVLDHVKDLDVHIQLDYLRQTIPFDALVAKQQETAKKEAAERVGASGAKKIGEGDGPQRNTPPNSGSAPASKTSSEPLHYAFVWTATGTFHGKPVKGDGRTGGVFALKHADHPFPLQADVRFGDTRIAFVGTLTDPTSPDALDLRLWLTGQSLAQLYDLLGITLPESPPYATEGRLVGQLVPDKERVRYEHFTARVGDSDLDGDLIYQNKDPRPLLSGTVNSKLLQFRDLAPLIGARPPSDDEHPAPQSANKVLPEEPFKPERWKVMDADVHFAGDRVFRDSELPIHKMDARIRMDNAVLSLDPLKFRFAYGDIDGAIKMDGSDVPIKGTIKATAKEVQLKRLIKLSDPSQFDIGNANATIDLTSSGNSVGDLLGAANGQVKALIGGGHISKTLMEEAALNMPNIVIAKITGDKQVQINCAAANFEANSGTFYSRLFLIDTDAAQITIDGTVDLASEKLDLTVHPDTKGLRLFSLRSPIHVQGTFKKPDIGIDKGVLFARGAGAVGLAVFAGPAAALLPLTAGLGKDDEDRCAPLLASMNKAPDVPAPKADTTAKKRKK
jgi:AsmA family protein